MPIMQERTAWPAGWPSVMSSAYERAPMTPDRAISACTPWSSSGRGAGLTGGGRMSGCHRRGRHFVSGARCELQEAEMKVLVAGATGALGRQLVPRLVTAGHEVTGTTRTPAKAALLEEWGARAAVLDALDPDAVAAAVAAAEPDVIVHQLTALGGV